MDDGEGRGGGGGPICACEMKKASEGWRGRADGGEEKSEEGEVRVKKDDVTEKMLSWI